MDDLVKPVPLDIIKGVGPRMAARLAKLGITTVQDLLFHLPIRYQDRTRITPIAALRPGDEAVVQGHIQSTQVRFGKRRTLVTNISDGTGALSLRFFYFSASQKARLETGALLRVFGQVRTGAKSLEIVHPEYQFITPDAVVEVDEYLTPVYPATEGLPQRGLRNVMSHAIQYFLNNSSILEEHIPVEILAEFNYPTIRECIVFLHRPPPDVSNSGLLKWHHPAQQRLIFEELLTQHLSLRRLRNTVRQHTAPSLLCERELAKSFLAQLPFNITAAQKRVIREIDQDIQTESPMQRLVQGDVGSGKTLVAFYAALQAIESGYQAAMMAPTELLAEQHFNTFKQWAKSIGIEVGWLSGKLTRKQRCSALDQITSGAVQLIVGTHALFQDEVMFAKLALIIVDEQHRFGVQQRLALRQKGGISGQIPHQLTMTATPIPRTLAMTVYADLECSVIDELPPGRTPVQTVVMPESRREEVIERVREACRSGQQVYWVCPLIEESEVLQCQAAQDTALILQQALVEFEVGLLHGRMKGEEKERVMSAFMQGKISLLVATTVIEVGVNVPNAGLMIIENAERLGLAQLHQLRGRVGRGSVASYCVLLYRGPLSKLAKERLQVLRNTNDGFQIADKDLELRGPGEVLGIRQTGMLRLHIADIVRDQYLFPQVTKTANVLLENYPKCIQPLISRWVGEAALFADV
jgi:ATP-dependent DNA helicase RecG